MLPAALCLGWLMMTVADANEPLAFDSQPIRVRRPLYVGGELAWNGLGGLGVQLGYDVHPLFSVDGAVGLGAAGAKFGVRGRCNFLKSRFTPFFAAGVSHSTGLTGTRSIISGDDKITFFLKPSTAAQLVGGVAYVAEGGFVMQATAGWAQLLGGDNVRAVSGQSNSRMQQDLRLKYGSGPVAGLTFGYAFSGENDTRDF